MTEVLGFGIDMEVLGDYVGLYKLYASFSGLSATTSPWTS